MTNGNDIIIFEEKNCGTLQPQFLESINCEETSLEIQELKLVSQEYWNFVEEEFNNVGNI